MIVRQINNKHTLASSILHMVMPMAYAVKRNFRSQMHWWNDTAGASNVDIVLYIVYSKILLWEDTAIPKIFIPKIFFLAVICNTMYLGSLRMEIAEFSIFLALFVCEFINLS